MDEEFRNQTAFRRNVLAPSSDRRISLGINEHEAFDVNATRSFQTSVDFQRIALVSDGRCEDLIPATFGLLRLLVGSDKGKVSWWTSGKLRLTENCSTNIKVNAARKAMCCCNVIAPHTRVYDNGRLCFLSPVT
jgi:hypothetical protein